MDVMEAMRQRHSYRSFSGEPVDHRLLERVIEAARLAPSAMNAQPWRFHIATGETRDRVGRIMQQTTIYLDDYLVSLGKEDKIEETSRFAANLGNAPVVVAISVPREDTEMAEVNTLLSAGAAIENLMLAATGYGLASCNITFSYWVRDEVARVLAVPRDEVIISLVLVGHPDGRAAAPAHDADVAVWHD